MTSRERAVGKKAKRQGRLEEVLPELVARLTDSIKKHPKVHHVGQHDLPSRDKVIDLLQDLRRLCFPGHLRSNLNFSNLEFFIGDLIDSIYPGLVEEVSKALYHESEEEGGPEVFRGQAEEIVLKFFDRLPKVRRLLETDVQAAFDGDPAAKSFAEVIICYPAIEAISTYRLAHELVGLGVPLIPRIMTEFAHHRTGIDIHPGATIGESFFIDHGTGVVIGETTTIGKHCKLYQGVTLGALSFPKDERGNIIRAGKRHPTLEDHVTVYAGATILGGETVIGEGSVIGGNVWLVKAVPPHTKVVIEEPNQKYVTKEKK
ncbi:MAG: serine O-acetyltransferase EpsC [bacterium]